MIESSQGSSADEVNVLFAVLGTIDEAVGVYDADDRLVVYNAHYVDVRGAIGGEVDFGARWIDLVRASVRAGKIPEAVGREEAWLQMRQRMRGSYSVVRRLDDGRVFQVNERRIPNGHIAVVWTNITALVTAQENAESILSEAAIRNERLLHEIEKRSQAEAELQRLKASLEARIEDRTAEFRAIVAQRDVLLREVFHRVKNNLQVVDSLLRMEMRRLTDTAATEALGNLRNRVIALGMVHSQLMLSESLKTFDIAPFLQQLAEHLEQSLSLTDANINLLTTVDHALVTMDFAVPVGLIFTELVTGALKRALRLDNPSGTVIVELCAVPGGFTLSVADSGASCVEAAADLRENAGTGSKIIHGLIRQLNAQMRVMYHAGAHVVVELPWSVSDD